MRLMLIGAIILSFHSYTNNLTRGFPNGTYVGVGKWWDNLNASGAYQAEVKFTNNQMHTKYNWPEGNISSTLNFQFGSQGAFDITRNGNHVGYGICVDQTCNYEINERGITFSESIRIEDGKLIKSGKKQKGHRISQWKDQLFLIED